MKPRLLKNSEIEAMSEKDILEEIFVDKTAVGIFYAGAAWAAFLVAVVNLFRGPPYGAILVAASAAVIASCFYGAIYRKQFSRLKKRLPAFKCEG
jgi:Flp pilus assembly protein TadB